MNSTSNNKFAGAVWLAIAVALAACTATATPAPTAQAPNRNRAAVETPAVSLAREVSSVPIISVDGALALGGPLVTASFETSGKVIAVNVQPGLSVKKGDVLAELDGSALNLALQLAQEKQVLKQAEIANSLAPSKGSDLDVARAGLASAYASYNIAKQGGSAQDIDAALRSWNQAKNALYAQQLNRDPVCAANGSTGKCQQLQLGVQSAEIAERGAHQKYLDAQMPPTQDKLSQSWSNIVQAQATLARLQSSVSDEQKKVYDLQLEQTSISIERARRDLSRTRLLAPCDCRVQTVNMSVGGNATGSITLLDGSQLRFRTSNLSERDVIKLVPGQPVTIRLKALPQPVPGKVSVVLPLSSGLQGTTALYTSLISLDAVDPALLPGMTGQAEISLK